MNIRQKRELYRNIISSITGNHLTGAFNGLKEYADHLQHGNFLNNIEAEEEVYHKMLDYYIADAPDPDRENLRDNISRSLFHLADVMFTLSLSQPVTGHYHHIRQRFINFNPFQEDDLEILERVMLDIGSVGSEELTPKIERLFTGIWMAPVLSSDHQRILKEYLSNEDSDRSIGVLIVTALILHTLERFSPAIWMLLADIYVTQINQLWQRALLGMMLTSIRFDHRMHLFPEIGRRLQLLAEDDAFTVHFEKAAIQLVRTGDTEKVSRRVQEEIIPELMKLAPKIQEQMSLDQLISDEEGEDKNPDWEKFFEESPGMYRKMEELNQLQSEGADLFISTFSHLKSFPFFRYTANWFIPYNHLHPSIKPDYADDTINEGMLSFFEAFEGFPVMCNSDKYSFSFNLTSMPQEQRSMIMGALSGEVSEIMKQAKSEELISDMKGVEVFHQFTQDLYRFFRVHPEREETEDPFAMQMQLYQCKVVSPLFERFTHLARRIGEYYFQQEHYCHAVSMFSHAEKEPQDNPELFQKIAYSWQMSGDLDKALEYYRRAELFDSNALWNLRKIAWCYHLQNRIPEAIRTYRSAELLAPDSAQIKVSIGNLLLQTNDWDKALEYYLKAEKLHPGSEKTLRPVAWCLFLKGDMEASAHYYEQIMERAFNHNDLLNYAHVKFALKERKEAFRLYRESLSNPKNKPETFIESFRNDTLHLIRLGVKPAEVSFMLDAVMKQQY